MRCRINFLKKDTIVMEAGRRNTCLFLTFLKKKKKKFIFDVLEVGTQSSIWRLYIWEFQVAVSGMEYIPRGRS